MIKSTLRTTLLTERILRECPLKEFETVYLSCLGGLAYLSMVPPPDSSHDAQRDRPPSQYMQDVTSNRAKNRFLGENRNCLYELLKPAMYRMGASIYHTRGSAGWGDVDQTTGHCRPQCPPLFHPDFPVGTNVVYVQTVEKEV